MFHSWWQRIDALRYLTRRGADRAPGRLRGPLLVVLTILALVPLGPVLTQAPAQAVQANPAGGLGRYQQVIDWIDWTDAGTIELRAGSSRTRWSTPTRASASPSAWRSSQCSVTEISRPVVLGYEPGTWSGDGLARLYNNGANYTNGQVKRGSSTRSGLPIGIANPRNASETITLTVSCRTYLILSDAQPTQDTIEGLPKKEIPMAGMVVADAESSTWSGNSGESITVQADSGRYRLLESARDSQCQTNSRGEWNTFTDATGARRTGLRLRSEGAQCSSARPGGWGPFSVLFVEGSSTIRTQMVSTGRSAVALGVVGYMDFGDAPESYGVAGSVFQPTWTGGLVGTDIRSDAWLSTTFNLTAASAAGNEAVAGAPATRLGASTDAEPAARSSVDAAGDDQDIGAVGRQGASDEDALTGPVQVRANQGQAFTQTLACTGPGQVRGWVDWNRDGGFDPATEASNQVDCAGGSATLQWDVPLTALRSVIGEDGGASTFMRLRISDDRSADGSVAPLEPTGITGSGEVEDYAVSVFVPALTLIKKVDATWAGSSVLEAQHWELSATLDQPGAAPVVSGAGGAPQTPVLPGTYNLAEAESTTHRFSPGYQPQGWMCYQTPGTVTPEGYVYSSSEGRVSEVGQTTGTVEIRNQDRVTCEITNRALPTTLSWSKTDEEGAALGGSQWSLAPVGPDGAEGPATAVTDNSAPDTDPAEGRITVTDLPWGTYRVRETGAPTGYNLSTEVKQGTYSGTDPRSALDLGAVVNTRITGAATWTKVDEEDQPLEGSQWTLTPVDPAGSTMEVDDCVQACSEQSLDKDPAPGAFSVPGLTYGTYSLVETTAPTGYRLDATPRQLTIANQDETVDLGRIANERITGTATWTKTGEDGSALVGSQWALTPVDPAGAPISVADCVLACSEQSLDRNPAAGAFTVPGLAYGRYTLVETTAPTGYRLDTTAHELAITTQGQSVEVGAIVNERITGTATWTKVNERDEPLEGSQWTLTPVDPAGSTMEVDDCVQACSEQSLDKDPAPGAFSVPGLTYGTYSLVEAAAPTGYRLDTTPRAISVTTEGQTVDVGRIVNDRITGTVTWTKVDEQGTALGGSQWTLMSAGARNRSVTIVDCVTACAEDSLDVDPEAGAFSISGLPYGEYLLVEAAAPAGYRLDTTPRTVVVTTHGEVVDLGGIVNSKSVVPAIPLTGGRGAHLFIIIGAGFSALAAGAAMAGRRRHEGRE